jgi:transitional endoplasmic reticulum ATPase
MAALKRELAETVGTVLAYGPEADVYGLHFNGLLLHGSPGTGKTFIARAAAGEYGMSFIHVSTGDLVSKYVGESAQNIDSAFRTAAANVPCLLFFDEFDSIAQRREDDPSAENRRIVNQLLTSLEQWRDNRDLFVVAATNHIDTLDPAVIRPGRFDRKIRVDLPDQPARVAILRAQLADRPTAELVDLDGVARRADGLTPAAIASVVQDAALAAFRASAQASAQVPITTEHLLAALAARGGQDRPAITSHGWDQLILDDRTLAELQQLQRLIEDPERAHRMGVDPPAGLLLTGPPGTGKTTIAKVLAAQTRCSFYPQSAADLTSKWVGDSEKKIRQLFDRARDNTPSIIFLDEIDAIAARRGSGFGTSVHDKMLTQLLTEIDGVADDPRRVFVLGATNRPEILDPALTRGGRLSRTIEIPLPDQDRRYSLLVLHTGRMPLAADVDLAAIAARTDGFSGGDIQALTQQAAVHAMMRDAEAADVAQIDFLTAIGTHTSNQPGDRDQPSWRPDTSASSPFPETRPADPADPGTTRES